MRNVGTYLLSVVLIAGALSAVVSMATVKWLYPKRPVERTPAAVQTAARTPDPAPAQAQATPQPQAQPQPASAEEKTALEFIRRAAGGDTAGAAALAEGLTAEALKEAITRHSPSPQRVAKLPGPAGSANVLVWVTLGTNQGRSLYQVNVAGGKVRSVNGPMAPEGGYGPFALALLDEQARPLDTAPYKGHALLLVSPRVPEPGLPELLNQLQMAYASRGIDVAVVMDTRSPDWAAAARAGGYKGPIWRVKARLEDVPLVKKGTLLGAYGILVDRDGLAVASLAALEPLNYNLPDETPASIATVVFRAYGLLP
ncbi:MAG TPA: hypothetical protein VNT01_12730 [Symbiobacteriaceae bacterium]|nr:hypothetical protein [Symbiobacteriaceae bacterium]